MLPLNQKSENYGYTQPNKGLNLIIKPKRRVTLPIHSRSKSIKKSYDKKNPHLKRREHKQDLFGQKRILTDESTKLDSIKEKERSKKQFNIEITPTLISLRQALDNHSRLYKGSPMIYTPTIFPSQGFNQLTLTKQNRSFFPSDDPSKHLKEITHSPKSKHNGIKRPRKLSESPHNTNQFMLMKHQNPVYSVEVEKHMEPGTMLDFLLNEDSNQDYKFSPRRLSLICQGITYLSDSAKEILYCIKQKIKKKKITYFICV